VQDYPPTWRRPGDLHEPQTQAAARLKGIRKYGAYCRR
jgi:hypothetical protein